MKFSDRIYLRWLKLKGVARPLRIAEKWRREGISIGKGTYVYKNVFLDTSKGTKITVGSDCVLTGCTILAHDASVNRFGLQTVCRPVVIKNRCFIGCNSTVLMGVTIEDDCIVGAGSLVTKDVPPGSVVAGVPAKVIGKTKDLVAKRRAEQEGKPAAKKRLQKK